MRKLDLHGFTLEDAYQEFTDFIYEAYQGSIPKVEVITGKSGQIRKEFPHWAESSHQIQYIEQSWHERQFCCQNPEEILKSSSVILANLLEFNQKVLHLYV